MLIDHVMPMMRVHLPALHELLRWSAAFRTNIIGHEDLPRQIPNQKEAARTFQLPYPITSIEDAAGSVTLFERQRSGRPDSPPPQGIGVVRMALNLTRVNHSGDGFAQSFSDKVAIRTMPDWPDDAVLVSLIRFNVLPEFQGDTGAFRMGVTLDLAGVLSSAGFKDVTWHTEQNALVLESEGRAAATAVETILFIQASRHFQGWPDDAMGRRPSDVTPADTSEPVGHAGQRYFLDREGFIEAMAPSPLR